MALNYAEKWQPQLIEILNQGCLTAPYITTNVNWLDAKTFHFTQMITSGYKPHNRAGGWNRGTYSQTDVPFTIAHTRDVEFFVDKAEVLDTNGTAKAENISRTFQITQAVPETDAYFYSKLAQLAIAKSLSTNTARSVYAANAVYTKLKKLLAKAKLKRYRANGTLIMYVASEIMDALELSTELTKKVEVTQINEGGLSVESRVTAIDTVPVFEVIDDERFYHNFDFATADGGFALISQEYTAVVSPKAADLGLYYEVADGVYTITDDTVINAETTYYTKKEGSRKLNVVIASTQTTFTVPRINSIFFFPPGQHTVGDGWLYQNRADWDTFVMPNGKDGEIDSIFVDIDTTEYVAEVE